MAVSKKKTCPKGHVFYKTSDCPTCPYCEQANKPIRGFRSKLSAPARRALDLAGIRTPKQLARFSETEILQLHGMGPASLPVLKACLKNEGLQFKGKRNRE